MTTTRRDRLGRWRSCLLGIGLVGICAFAVAIYVLMSGKAWVPSSQGLEIVHASGLSEGPGAAEDALVPIDLDLRSVQLVLRPNPDLDGLVVRSQHDPQRYDLTVEEVDTPSGAKGLRVQMAPRSKALAFLGMKLGHDLPRLVIELPPAQALTLEGSLATAFGAFELGGLTVKDLDLEVEGGGATVSLLEPLGEPMESFRLTGDKGSLEVTGLGHASPRTAFFRQSLGELDLDLRGSWQRDATVDVEVRLAGGSCWLPRNADVTGGAAGPVAEPPREAGADPRPTLDLRLSERGGRMVVID